MAQATLKDQLAELEKRVRDGAGLMDPVARATIELVKLSLDDAKESLVSATGDDMLRLQGKAQFLVKMLKNLTTAPPTIPEN